MTIKEAWEIVQHPMSPSNFKGDKLLEATKMVNEALTELERLQKFKATFDAYELSQKQGFIAYENWQECEKEIEYWKKMHKNREDEIKVLRQQINLLLVIETKESDEK